LKIVFSHPTGNANVRATASALEQANLLFRFNTTIACFPGSFLDYISSVKPFSDIKRRQFDVSLKPFTQLTPWYEVGRLISSKAGFTKLTKHERGIFCIDSVYRNLDKAVARTLKQALKKGAKAVYAYEDAAAASFGEAKRLGLFCFYDLPIGYWRASRELLEMEKERWPEWAPTITGFDDSETKLKNKDAELSLADHIFVASRFTAETLEKFRGSLAPIEIIPYGFPEVVDQRNYSKVTQTLRLLFVGSITQRKGIADLLTAVAPFRQRINLTIVGHMVTDKCKVVECELLRHNWIPSLPHYKVLDLMRKNDVLIFPSLFEGFGLVITEAMSQGTPVITTERTAGPDLI